MDILRVNEDLKFNTSITNIELRDHEAFAGTRYGNADEICIEIKNQDIYTLPCESLLYVEGKLLGKDGSVSTNTKLVKNFLAHMISEIHYKINNVEIDQTRNVGVASFLKGMVSFSPDKLRRLTKSGWSTGKSTTLLNIEDGCFNVALPLNTLMGFFEDYTKILINCKQELIILRSQNDFNAVVTTPTPGAGANPATTEETQIIITKLKWKMPQVEVDDKTKLRLMSYLREDKPIFLGFRSWFIAEKPMPTTVTRDEWQMQAVSPIERPRYIIVAFQTGKRDIVTADINSFDHCDVKNIKAYINGKRYPYVDYNMDIKRKQCAMLYAAYDSFQKSYYGTDPKPLLSYSDFIEMGTIFVIDCSKQNESLKSSSVDLKLEIEAANPFPANTTAFCLVIHDKIVEYNVLTNMVRKHI